ncbi:hypothetical protein D9756_011389 [Leucocoprinus leucothites]|uniref:Uncharacterized protein n=1 Tax=Leucocoprinus leucothites TaxID=201217 RepID=A0A8H5CSR9_9AGAR|nr:hypothetical protein D9756_011389 [Leucoagaricus leucothites]
MDTTSSDSEPCEEQQKCTSCGSLRPTRMFKQLREGFSKTCEPCLAKRTCRYVTAKIEDQAEGKLEEHDEGYTAAEFDGLSEMPLDVFLGTLSSLEDEVSLAARVNISGWSRKDDLEVDSGDDELKALKGWANKLRDLVSENANAYKFKCTLSFLPIQIY